MTANDIRTGDDPRHEHFMRECLTLAGERMGEVGNGAMVGAKLVLENKIIAQGLHKGFGKAHAERDLLLNFPGTVPPDAILYVNLEPCCHVGKTPPCTDIILRKGVKRVCFGMRDPDERVCGRGEALLRREGVEVTGPVARASCEYFNRGFVNLRKRHRPWVILKSARTPQGRSAAEDSSPLKITGEEQDRWAHTMLRSRVDAILVGVQTVINDDPTLDTRWSQAVERGAGLHRYQPWRLILDPHLRTPLTARVVSDDRRTQTIIVTSPTLEAGKEDRRKGLQGRGVAVWDVPVFNGSFDFPELWNILSRPEGAFHGITSILVEGGARTLEVFRGAGMVDEEVVMVGK